MNLGFAVKPRKLYRLNIVLRHGPSLPACNSLTKMVLAPGLAAEAMINEYLDLNEWQVAGIQKAVASLDRGEGVAHEQVKEWVSSWNSKKERPAPKRSAT